MSIIARRRLCLTAGGISAVLFAPSIALATTTITDCVELQSMNDQLAEDYMLGGDIDCTGMNFDPIGDNTSHFTGSLNGGGYTISNLTIDQGSNNYVGMFAHANGANIQNVRLENVHITCGAECGVIAGRMLGGSSVESVFIKDFTITSNDAWLGGVAGIGISSSINQVALSSEALTSGGNYVGGIFGFSSSATIEDSYTDDISLTNGLASGVGGVIGWVLASADVIIDSVYVNGDISGNSGVGAVVGLLQDNGGACSLSDAFAVGSVDGALQVGAIVGRKYANCAISNSYFNDTDGNPATCVGLDGDSDTTDCTGIGDDEGYFYDSAHSPLNAWDFVAVWHEALQFPWHRWSRETVIPSVVAFSPLNGASDVSVATNLVINFDEPIGRWGTGTVAIYRSSDNGLVEQIAVNGPLVSGSGSDTLTISLSSDLAAGASYYVHISDNSFPDGSGNYYGGISNDTTWSFTTLADAPPATNPGPDSASERMTSGGGARGSRHRGGTSLPVVDIDSRKVLIDHLNRRVNHSFPLIESNPNVAKLVEAKDQFKERVCQRVMRRFVRNRTILDRVNQRLSRRFAFTC